MIDFNKSRAQLEKLCRLAIGELPDKLTDARAGYSWPIEFEGVPSTTLLQAAIGGKDKAPKGNARAQQAAELRNWARVSIREAVGDQITIGSPTPRYRISGVTTIQLFGPAQGGQGVLRTAASVIVNYLIQQSDGEVRMRPRPYMVTLGRQEPDWFQINVVVPFEVDQLFNLAA